MMQDFPSIDDIKVFLPKYLSEEDQKKLFDQLKEFPTNIDKRMYSTAFDGREFLLQGDGVANIKWPPQTEGGEFINIKALVMSNTCDISEGNPRVYEAYCTFAPIFKISSYEKALIEDGHLGAKVKDHLNAIRDQKITPFFYIPKTEGLGDECFVRFDLVFSLPVPDDLKEVLESRIFSLSNYGFYLLLFKYSIHTNRIQERVARD
jgi:hypothetical protein